MVPGPADTAIVPGSRVDVDVDTVVGRLVVGSSTSVATVFVGDGFNLESGSTAVLDTGDIYIAPGGELVLRNDALVDGFVDVDEAGGVGLLTLDGEVAVSGTGSLNVPAHSKRRGPEPRRSTWTGSSPSRPRSCRSAKEHSSSLAPI